MNASNSDQVMNDLLDRKTLQKFRNFVPHYLRKYILELQIPTAKDEGIQGEQDEEDENDDDDEEEEDDYSE